MKTLYLKLFELLKTIPEIEYIDLNFGQIMEEQPPLAYPAVLIGINIVSTDSFHDIYQQVNAEFTITLVTRAQDTCSLTEKDRQERALSYFDLAEKIYNKLQGYEDGHFETFNRLNLTEITQRKGLRITAERYSCSWKQEASKP